MERANEVKFIITIQRLLSLYGDNSQDVIYEVIEYISRLAGADSKIILGLSSKIIMGTVGYKFNMREALIALRILNYPVKQICRLLHISQGKYYTLWNEVKDIPMYKSKFNLEEQKNVLKFLKWFQIIRMELP